MPAPPTRPRALLPRAAHRRSRRPAERPVSHDRPPDQPEPHPTRRRAESDPLPAGAGNCHIRMVAGSLRDPNPTTTASSKRRLPRGSRASPPAIGGQSIETASPIRTWQHGGWRAFMAIHRVELLPEPPTPSRRSRRYRPSYPAPARRAPRGAAPSPLGAPNRGGLERRRVVLISRLGPSTLADVDGRTYVRYPRLHASPRRFAAQPGRRRAR